MKRMTSFANFSLFFFIKALVTEKEQKCPFFHLLKSLLLYSLNCTRCKFYRCPLLVLQYGAFKILLFLTTNVWESSDFSTSYGQPRFRKVFEVLETSTTIDLVCSLLDFCTEKTRYMFFVADCLLNKWRHRKRKNEKFLWNKSIIKFKISLKFNKLTVLSTIYL